MNDNTTAQTITRRIGHTTYRVSVHFSKTSRETVNDKILRLIRTEVTRTSHGKGVRG